MPQFLYNNKWYTCEIQHVWITCNNILYKDVNIKYFKKYFKTYPIHIKYVVIRKKKIGNIKISQGYIVDSNNIKLSP